MMGPGFGDAIARSMTPAFVFVVIAFVIVIVCVFLIGRCSVQHPIEIRSPVVTKESKNAQ